MKLAIIAIVAVPPSYGGFEDFVDHIIGDDENQYTVYCSGKHYLDQTPFYKGATLVYSH